jgi:hypothetical protein
MQPNAELTCPKPARQAQDGRNPPTLMMKDSLARVGLNELLGAAINQEILQAYRMITSKEKLPLPVAFVA